MARSVCSVGPLQRELESVCDLLWGDADHHVDCVELDADPGDFCGWGDCLVVGLFDPQFPEYVAETMKARCCCFVIRGDP